MNTLNTFQRPKIHRTFFSVYLFFVAGISHAQIDAGALQLGLEQQLSSPSPLALPEPTAPKPLPAQPAAQGDVRFEVKSFVLEGVNTIPEEKVQAVFKEWFGRPVNFDYLQKATDAVVNLYRASGFTVQAILPPQKITDGVMRILVTKAKLHGMHPHRRQAVSDPEPV